MENLTKCPYCGSADGLYNDFNVSGRSFYKFNGKEDGEDITSLYRHNKYMVCVNCRKRIMTYEEICCRMKIFKSYGQIMYQIILNNGKMLNKNLQKGGETLSWLQEDQNMMWKICLSND